MQLTNIAFREPIEAIVSDYQGRAWRVKEGKDLSDLACHPCAILSNGSFSVFAKYSEARDAERQFEIEQDSLAFLAEKAGVLIPRPRRISGYLAVVAVGGAANLERLRDAVESYL